MKLHKRIKHIEEIVGHHFADENLVISAITHPSAAEGKAVTACYERLEFLGDSVLGVTVADHLYRQYGQLPEGGMTRLRAELVCEQSLHAVALDLKLGDYLRLGRGEEHSGGRERPSILADAVEAVIAAMYLDGGLEPARTFILGHILVGVEEGEIHHVKDYKTELQEVVQRRADQHLRYELVDSSGPDHMKRFTMAVFLNDAEIGRGDGHSKKEAEQEAAKAALKAYQ